MKVKMILTNAFTFDFRVLREASTLSQNGHDVEILCWDRENVTSNKDIDIIDNIKVKRFFPRAKSETGIKQIIPFLKFIFQSKKYLRNKEVDIIHAHDLDGLITGFFCKSRKMKLIYDSHEFFSGMRGLKISPFFFILEWILLKRVDSIISVSPSICTSLKKLYSPKNKPLLIRNTPNKYTVSNKHETLRARLKISENQKILVYQGMLNADRGLENLIQILTYLEDNIVIVLIGTGSFEQNLRDLATKLNVNDRVFFTGHIEHEKLLNYTSSADLAIYLLNIIKLNTRFCLPNKIFEFIQAEIPIISTETRDVKKLIRKYSIGETVNPSNIEDTVDKIKKILTHSQEYKNNLIKAKKELSWENEEKKLIEFYKKL
ncbi:glycosyltransferase [Endozoicomonadaceae bacterium StTr2]